MSSLVVLAFPDESGAQNVLTVVNDLQKQRLITIDDAATVVRGQDGKPKVKQATSLVGAGAWGGAFWGMLLGLLFFVPFLGLAIGAVTGALMGKFTDVGIDDKFIRDVGEKVKPGQSALFLLVREATMDRVLAALKPYGPEVLQTSLSTEQEARLREAFGGVTEAEAQADAAPPAAPAAPARPGGPGGPGDRTGRLSRPPAAPEGRRAARPGGRAMSELIAIPLESDRRAAEVLAALRWLEAEYEDEGDAGASGADPDAPASPVGRRTRPAAEVATAAGVRLRRPCARRSGSGRCAVRRGSPAGRPPG